MGYGKKNWLILILLTLFIALLFTPTINSAKLTDFNITINVTSPNSATVVETWNIIYNYADKQDFYEMKQKIINASLDLAKLQLIDPQITPHVYLNKFDDFKISFNDVDNTLRLEYDIPDLVLLNYFENDDQILWKFNENILKNFISNDLFYFPDTSKMSLVVYSPLVLEDPIPTGTITDNKLTWSGFTTNEIKVLALEKKPPKPSFVVSNIFKDMSPKGLYNYLIIIFLLVIIVFIFKKRLRLIFKKFIIEHSYIEPKKPRKDLFDNETLEE